MAPSLVYVAIALDPIFQDEHAEFATVKDEVGYAVNAIRSDSSTVADPPRRAGGASCLAGFPYPHLAQTPCLSKGQEIGRLGGTGNEKYSDKTQ